MRAGAYRAALQIFESLLRESPDNVGLLNDTGLAYVYNNNAARAETSFRRVLELQPSHEAAFFNLLDLLIQADRVRDARDAFVTHESNISKSDAKDTYARKLELGPQAPPAHTSSPTRSPSGNAIHMGVFAGPQSLRLLAILGDRIQCQNAVQNGRLDTQRLVHVLEWSHISWFECSKLLSQISNKVSKITPIVCFIPSHAHYEAFFSDINLTFVDVIVCGNREIERQVKNAHAHSTAHCRFHVLKDGQTPEAINRLLIDEARTEKELHPSPLLVVGNQKSGTTAIAGLLSQHTNTPATLDFLNQRTVARLLPLVHTGKINIHEFVEGLRFYFQTPIVKAPNLTFLCSELKTVFPDSPFIHIVRDPRDNIRSILKRLQLPGNLNDVNISEVAPTPVWEFIMDGSALGYATGNYIERLARRWRAAVQVYLQHSESSTLVRYEDFLSDKPAFIRDLASRVGLESRVDISHRVDHQWVHRGNSKVSWSDFFSAGNLKRIEDICHEEMEAVGYPIDQDKARH
jgi:hypothetical protein